MNEETEQPKPNKLNRRQRLVLGLVGVAAVTGVVARVNANDNDDSVKLRDNDKAVTITTEAPSTSIEVTDTTLGTTTTLDLPAATPIKENHDQTTTPSSTETTQITEVVSDPVGPGGEYHAPPTTEAPSTTTTTTPPSTETTEVVYDGVGPGGEYTPPPEDPSTTNTTAP